MNYGVLFGPPASAVAGGGGGAVIGGAASGVVADIAPAGSVSSYSGGGPFGSPRGALHAVTRIAIAADDERRSDVERSTIGRRTV